jgi:hypothetical protein
MFKILSQVAGFSVNATDGAVGKIKDFLLDDEHWTTRYFVVETGHFFNQRRVLLTPASLEYVDWRAERFELRLSREKVNGSPDIDADKPVSRQREMEFARYYGYPHYWAYAGVWGMGAHPGFLVLNTPDQLPPKPTDNPGDVHLRSMKELRGYHIEGTDEALGHVDDFIVDEATWQIRYLVIDTRNWWPGKKVLLAPSWADHVSWEERRVYVRTARDVLKSSPEWNGNLSGLTRSYEERLHEHYGYAGYWGPPDAARQGREAS